MRIRPLESPEAVLVAYLLSPMASLMTLWLCFALYSLQAPGFGIVGDLFVLSPLLLVAGPACAVAEFIVVTPLLWGFERYRWRWLNGWSACAIGFAIGLAPWLAFWNQLVPHGWTPTNWPEMIGTPLVCGLAGLVGALVFRRVAMRAVDDSEEAGAEGA